MSTAWMFRHRWLCLILLVLAVMAVLGHVCALLPIAEAAAFPATTHADHHEDLDVASCEAAVSSSAQAWVAGAPDGEAVDALPGELHGTTVIAAGIMTARPGETASPTSRAALFLLHQVFLI